MTNSKLALHVLRYLLVTATMFVGIDHFMSIEQGWVALFITALWFIWSFGNAKPGPAKKPEPDTGVADEDSYWRTGDITGTDV